MAGDSASGASHDGDLPEPVREWLSRIATERGVSETELLRQLVPEAGPDRVGPVREAFEERLDALAAELDAADDRVDAVESSVEETREDFERKIDDVRERVVQVKREADAKADTDHDHEDLEAEFEAVRGELDAILSDVDDLRADLDELDDRVSTGFENFRSVLEYLTDTTDELDGKFDRLAEALLGVRGRVRSFAAVEAERAAVADLAAEANRHGVRSAVCESCDGSVDVGLLAAPRCPHCDAGFRALEPKQGFFGSSSLLTGEVPALEGNVAGRDDELASIVEADATADEPREVADLGAVGSPDEEPADESTDAASDSDESDAAADEAEDGLVTEEFPAEDDAGGKDDGDPQDDIEPAPDEQADDPFADESAGDRFEEEFESEGDAGPTDPDGGTGTRSDSAGGEPDGDDEPGDGRPLQAIDGVGPTYADRLRDAGVTSVEDLVDADAEEVAAAVDVSPARTGRWIGRAEDVVGDE